jgi:hypothetical protein
MVSKLMLQTVGKRMEEANFLTRILWELARKQLADHNEQAPRFV